MDEATCLRSPYRAPLRTVTNLVLAPEPSFLPIYGPVGVLPRKQPQDFATYRTAPAGVAVGKVLNGVRPLGLALHTAMGGTVGGDPCLLIHAVMSPQDRPTAVWDHFKRISGSQSQRVP